MKAETTGAQERREARREARIVHARVGSQRDRAPMHPITFCIRCEEAIPLKALACFRCGARQPQSESAVPVIFCEKCGRDYLAKAVSCHHCGHLNSRHPLVKGHIAS